MNTASASLSHADACFTFNGATINLMAESAEALIADLAKFGITGPTPATATKPAAEKPKAEQTATGKVETPKDEKKPEVAKDKVDYPTLQKSVFELAGLVQKKGLDSTDHVLAIAVKHGAPNFKGLTADVYAAALADVKAKIVEVAALEAEVA